MDYNDTIGLGCDGAESPGEGLRQHIAGVQAFFREIRRQLPHLVIENCASGGHRLEPSMMALCSMGSFSDAHETVEIPIIAANLHGVILPRQSQVWAVLRASDRPQRSAYSLAATFLGRMAISGDLAELSSAQLGLLAEATAFYRGIVPIIKYGQSRRFGSHGVSFRHPTGWQALRRVSSDGSRVLCVIHTFTDPPQEPLTIPLPPGQWKISSSFQCPDGVETSGNHLVIPQQPAFTGFAVLLESFHPARSPIPI